MNKPWIPQDKPQQSLKQPSIAPKVHRTAKAPGSAMRKFAEQRWLRERSTDPGLTQRGEEVLFGSEEIKVTKVTTTWWFAPGIPRNPQESLVNSPPSSSLNPEESASESTRVDFATYDSWGEQRSGHSMDCTNGLCFSLSIYARDMQSRYKAKKYKIDFFTLIPR